MLRQRTKSCGNAKSRSASLSKIMRECESKRARNNAREKPQGSIARV